jgi:asparagine synthase (glutamine-hydrolysing)
MVRTIQYRGPDGTGIHVNGSVGLAHNRLSIIDIAGGSQPMESDDGALWITFNGEIFNFIELREQLEKKGYAFKTRSDTEVILRLYQQYGTDCVTYMNGQWAFAIWDLRNKRLFLSRDRVGVRPLFYTRVGQTVLFGSEVKALLVHPGVKRELDPQALSQVFTFWFSVTPRTVFKGIQELPPGHSMLIENGDLRVLRYWQLNYAPQENVTSSDDHRYEEQFCELLLDATRLRLRADVPVGAYLSGGLDSSITTALAKRFVGSSLCTFSVTFEDKALDESKYQDEVVQALDTRHQTIRCSSQDVCEGLPDVIWHSETPILRTAPTPLLLLSRLVRESGFKVVLTGEGADEFLGGYDIYKEAKIRAFWAAQIDSKYRPLLLRRLYPYLEGIHKQSPAYLRAFFHVAPQDVSNPFFSHVPRWELTSRTKAFFSPDFRAELTNSNGYSDIAALLPSDFNRWDTFSRAQYLEGGFLLPGYILSSQGDRVAMANSVEGRYPFLDYRIVEFSATLPMRVKMRVLNEKYLLKKVFGDLVPPAVRNRPKQPYRAPDAISFYDPTTGKARHPYVEDLLSPDRVRANGIFDAVAVQKLVEKARAGRTSGFVDNASLVGILSTQMLIDHFILHFEEKLSHADRRTCAPVCN